MRELTYINTNWLESEIAPEGVTGDEDVNKSSIDNDFVDCLRSLAARKKNN